MDAVSVGIDPSANSTGVVILAADGRPLLQERIIPNKTGLARLVHIRDTLTCLLKRHGPFSVGVRESYSMGSINRPFLLGEVGGIVQLALHDSCDRVEECAPRALKKFVSGNAGATKEDMVAAVNARWGMQYSAETDDDLADAHGLAQIGLHLLKLQTSGFRAQNEVLAQIRNSTSPSARKKGRNAPFRAKPSMV